MNAVRFVVLFVLVATAAGAIEATTCPAGYYHPNGMDFCLQCPNGHKCEDPHSAPEPCPLGTYSYQNGNIGATSCTPCSLGYYANETASMMCKQCPNGYFCPDPTATPLACSVGTYSLQLNGNGATSCTPCSLGYYANETASMMCKQCPNGYSCPDPTATPVACPIGTYSLQLNGVGATSCTPCSLGYYANETASMMCKQCPNGYFCPDPAETPLACPVGTYSLQLNGIGATSCTPCSEGYYANETGSMLCRQCPSGHFCPDPTAAPEACPPGTHSMQFGAVGMSSCLKCAEGYYADQAGSQLCRQCPNGYTCVDPTALPVACPLGTYSFAVSGAGLTRCLPCAEGYYADEIGSPLCRRCPNGFSCKDPTASPVPCPLGTYSFLSGAAGPISCTPCSLGFYANETGTALCKQCPNGHFCSDPAATPVPCPVGTFSFVSGFNGGPTSCTRCASGFYAHEIGTVLCRECPAGHFCCDPKAPPKQCPAGTYSVASGSGISRCSLCPAGLSNYQAGSFNCFSCPDCPVYSGTEALSCPTD